MFTTHEKCQTLNTYRTAVSPTLDLLCHEDFNVGRSEAEEVACRHVMFTTHEKCQTLNTYRTAVSPTLDLLCHEDFNVGRSEAESNIEIFMAQ